MTYDIPAIPTHYTKINQCFKVRPTASLRETVMLDTFLTMRNYDYAKNGRITTRSGTLLTIRNTYQRATNVTKECWSSGTLEQIDAGAAAKYQSSVDIRTHSGVLR